MILDWVVERGNTADTTLMVRMLDRLEAIYGRYPRQVAVDGGFASKENLRLAREKPGVVDVACAKKRGLTVEEMATSRRVYRKLRDFRAGIEGIISFLKRVLGMGRCTRSEAVHHLSVTWEPRSYWPTCSFSRATGYNEHLPRRRRLHSLPPFRI